MATKFDVSDVNLDVELENKADDSRFYMQTSIQTMCRASIYNICYCSLVPQVPGELTLPQITIEEVEDNNEGPSLSAERKNININQYTLTSEDNLALYEVSYKIIKFCMIIYFIF